MYARPVLLPERKCTRPSQDHQANGKKSQREESVTLATGPKKAVVVGGGIFGLSAAIELRARRWSVTLLDRGPIPSPDASSTDTSKIVRVDYGDDAFHHGLAEKALEGWDRWNREWPRPLYHETGFLLLAADKMTPGGFEHDSFEMLRARGHEPLRLADAGQFASGPWRLSSYPDGYLNTRAGWVESEAAVVQLREMALRQGVEFREAIVDGLTGHGSTVTGIRLADGLRLAANVVVVAAGAWTPALVPEVAPMIRSVAQPVLYFRPSNPDLFTGTAFPVWAADTQNRGWYGFPALPDGSVKVGHHGKGIECVPDRRPIVSDAHEKRTRRLLHDLLPPLADAPIVRRRTCMYCDSADGDLFIGADPERRGLVVAAGGSGHGFKFAPVLGPIIADAVEGRANPAQARYGWRSDPEERTEASRSMA